MTGLLFPGTWQDRGGHAYFQDLTALAPLLSHATARSRWVAITAGGGLNAGTGKPADSRRSPVCRQCRRGRDHVTLVRVHRAARAGMFWPTDGSAWLRECARVRWR
jgi:hypothetical protein